MITNHYWLTTATTVVVVCRFVSSHSAGGAAYVVQIECIANLSTQFDGNPYASKCKEMHICFWVN